MKQMVLGPHPHDGARINMPLVGDGHYGYVNSVGLL
jgi:hypothetical protein